MIRTYFNQRAAIWDETVAEKDETKLGLPFLLSKVGRNGKIVALDLAEEMLRQARKKSFNGEVYHLNADVTDIPLPDEAFDSVVCYSSFPHFQDKLRALSEINRVTRAGGHLFICHTSSRADINKIHNGIPEVASDIIPDKEEMQIMLAAARFIDVEIEDNCEDYLCYARKA